MLLATETWTQTIKNAIEQSIQTKQGILTNGKLFSTIEAVCRDIIKCYRNDGKVLFCGNGGSAADAQHLAAELSGKFYMERDPLFAEALHVNTSYMTAVANDYSYDLVYSRLVKSKGRQGDVIIGISTSGNSVNIIKAFEVAKQLGMITVGLTREGECAMKNVCDHVIAVPATDTARIQESHIMIGHIICQIVESELFTPA